MKMIPELEEAFNKSILKEMESAYRYAAMAVWLKHHALDGMAHWMSVQSKEEMEHAEKFKEYMELRGNKVVYQALSQPKSEWKSPLEVFEDTLASERSVSQWVKVVRDLSLKLDDPGAILFLDWFISEQENEEYDAQENLDNFALAEITHETKSGLALLFLDKKMSKREED